LPTPVSTPQTPTDNSGQTPTPRATPPQTGLACSIPDPFANGIPIPGTKEWCANEQAIKGYFVSLGQWVIDLVTASTGLSSILGPAGKDSNGFVGVVQSVSNISGIAPIVSSLLSSNSSFATNVRSIVDCWTKVIQQTSSCDPKGLLGLAVIRGVIGLLRKLRGGWDVAVWLTADIEVVVDPIERTLDYLIQSTCPVEIPGIGDAINAYILGDIDSDTLFCWLRMRGANPDVWEPIIISRRNRLTASERIDIGRRTGQTDAEITKSLRQVGYTTEKSRESILNLSYKWLDIEECILASQRKLDNQKFVADYGLDSGFADHFFKPYGKAIRVNGVNEDLARWKWGLHWNIPGIGELREMFHRLRPGDVEQGLEFTANDYKRWVGTTGHLPYFAKRIDAISYNPMPIRIMRVALTAGALPCQSTDSSKE
jgi:hypothetical protein